MEKPYPTIVLRSGLPRHEQVSSWIRTRIESGELGPDEQLPSESRLCDQFSVSRITIRRALQTLESEGLIYKRQGLGSFVSSGQLRQGFVNLSDFVEDMAAAGIHARSKIIGWETAEAPANVARALAVADGSTLERLDRIRYADDEAIAFDSTWFRPSLARIVKAGDLTSESIYRIVESRANIGICSGRFRMEAVNAPNDIAGHLDIPWGRALLLIERTTMAENGKPVCFQARYYRSDRVAYELVLDRGLSSGRSKGGSLPLREFEPVFKS